MVSKIFYPILTILFLSGQLSAQDCTKATGDKKLAEDYFSVYYNYRCALKEYMMLLAQKPKDIKYNHRAAQCHLKMNGGNKSKAIPFLEVVLKSKKVDNEVYFDMGLAQLYSGNNDKAIEFFNKYIEIAKPSSSELETTEKHIQFARNAKELMRYPVDVTFENCGEDVNSEYSEYTPYVTNDEDFIMFSTNQKGTSGGYEYFDGYTPDVYWAKLKNGKSEYGKAKSIGATFNTEYSEEIAGGSPDGSYLIINTDIDFQILNLKISYKSERARSYPRPENLEGINEKNSNELAAAINNEGDLIIFCSDRKGGYGGYDLWLSRKLPNDKWGTPVNLGPTINTPYDELYPTLNADQNTIYFSSNGHFSMGGFDLFETTFSEDIKTWTAPKNLGYPINTNYDDFNIIFTPSGRNAYKSAVRNEGYGMWDIYRLTFNKALPQYTVLKGQVKMDSTFQNLQVDAERKVSLTTSILDSLRMVNAEQVLVDSLQNLLSQAKQEQDLLNPYTNNRITVYKTENDELYGEYIPNSKTGKFILILEPGKYKIQFENEGFVHPDEIVTILDKSNYTPEFSRDFHLKPKGK